MSSRMRNAIRAWRRDPRRPTDAEDLCWVVVFFMLLVVVLQLSGCSSGGYRVVRIRTADTTGQGMLVSPDRVRTVLHVAPPVGGVAWVAAPFGAWVRALVVARGNGWADLLLEEPACRGWSGSPVYAWVGSIEGAPKNAGPAGGTARASDKPIEGEIHDPDQH